MLLYRDIISGDEMISDAFKIEEIDDIVYEVNCRMFMGRREREREKPNRKSILVLKLTLGPMLLLRKWKKKFKTTPFRLMMWSTPCVSSQRNLTKSLI
jgi:hypothetical protein